VRELPMFPLGTVLFPHMVLPLHVFEPRYRALMHDIIDGTREFGVVLISRGHEVGGGELRTDVGTTARIVQAEELDDGRWLAITVGVGRFRIDRWLPDAPYPRAVVEDLEDPTPGPQAADRLERLVPRLRRVLAMGAELGDASVPATFDLAEDLQVACWQSAVLAPLTPLDAQRVLTAATCDDRLDAVAELLDGVEETLTFRLHPGA
jgi:uncharacterized protein